MICHPFSLRASRLRHQRIDLDIAQPESLADHFDRQLDLQVRAGHDIPLEALPVLRGFRVKGSMIKRRVQEAIDLVAQDGHAV